MAAAKMKPPRSLNFITGNANKLAEVRAILSSSGPNVEINSKSIDVPEMQAANVEELTRDKCLRAAAAVNGPVLVEDTCLVFKAWGELPGPYIKWFLAQFGPTNLYRLLEGFPDKSAQAVCTFGYAGGPGGAEDVLIFQGRTDGKLVPARGPQTFGWDAAFEYEGKTYAEMDKTEKNAISHRGKALEKLREWLASV